MKKILAAFLIFSSIGLSVIALGVGGSATPRPNASADAFNRGQDVDNSSAIVQLKGDPLSIHSATKPAPGKKIDFNSYTVRSYRAQLSAGRNDFRRWLRANASRARITSEYDVSLNAVAVQLNGTPLETIAAAPMVERVQYNALYHPNLSESYKIINASDAWTAAGGRSVAGTGIKIGDIDTGNEELHLFFDHTGFSYPAGFSKCDAADSTSHHPDQDCEYVSPKVIVAKVFYNKAHQQGLDAQAIQDHGTHTAGIAAGVTGKTAVVNGVSIDDISGIAPGAWLGNYNVFPGNVDNARSEDILNAVDAAIADGMDVLNLSLGGTYHGTCIFSTKVRNAIAAGAIGVLVINNVAGDPTAMSKDGGGGDDLPAVMIGLSEGSALRASGETTASAVATFEEFITPNKDILAGFSSQGPTAVDFAVKPDLTSVGVNVLSSITCVGKPDTCPGDGTGWAFFSGTSMSTPHIAGSAAVLLNLTPSWYPAEVKSALVNRADLVVKDAKTGIHDIGPTAQGAGRENLSVAADATTWLDPVSASFGKVTVGHPTSFTMTLFNPTGSDQTFSVSTTKFTPDTFGGTVPSIYDAGTLSAGDSRITVPSSVTVPANGSTTLTVSVSAAHGDVVQGWINLDGAGSNDLHFAYYAVVGP